MAWGDASPTGFAIRSVRRAFAHISELLALEQIANVFGWDDTLHANLYTRTAFPGFIMACVAGSLLIDLMILTLDSE